MNKDGEVQIIPVDLFHPVTGLLFPFVIQRVRAFAEAHFSEVFPEAQAREVATRLAAGDKNTLVGAFISPDGRLIGHAVAVIQQNYGKKWVFVTQCKLDEPGGDAVTRGIRIIEDWGRAAGADLLIFETRRSDSSWVRAYGFKTMRHLMWKSLNGQLETKDLAETKEGADPESV